MAMRHHNGEEIDEMGQDCHCSHHHRHPSRQQMRKTGLWVLWDLGWKAAAITVALRRDDKQWVLPLALINTVGILPIAYLLAHRGPHDI